MTAAEKLAAKDVEETIAILEGLIAKNPRNPAVQLLARTYAEKGDLPAAVRTWEKLVPFPALRGNALIEVAALHLAQTRRTRRRSRVRR